MGAGACAAFFIGLLAELEELGEEEEFGFRVGLVPTQEGFPEFAGNVLAVLSEGEVVGDECDGGGIKSMVEMGEGTDIPLWFGGFAQDPMAIGAGEVGGVSVRPRKSCFALVVGAGEGAARESWNGFARFLLFGERGLLECLVFAPFVRGEGQGPAVVVFVSPEGVTATDARVAKQIEEVP